MVLVLAAVGLFPLGLLALVMLMASFEDGLDDGPHEPATPVEKTPASASAVPAGEA